MEGMVLAAESEKPLSSQEPEGHQSGGVATESLHGETKLLQMLTDPQPAAFPNSFNSHTKDLVAA